MSDICLETEMRYKLDHRLKHHVNDSTRLQYKNTLTSDINTIAVISIAVPDKIKDKNSDAWQYVFYLPLTAQSWLRFGYHVSIHIVFDSESIDVHAMKLLESVLEALLELPSLSIYYIDVRSNFKIRLSQILRIYAAHIGSFSDDSFIVLSDSDLWPIQKSRLELNQNQNMLITNSACCGTFEFESKTYQHFAMAHNGMRVSDWIKLFQLSFDKNGAIPKSLAQLPFLIKSGPF